MDDARTLVVPADLAAEQNVLGGLMLAPEALPEIADLLAEDDFFRGDHRAIFRAINALAEQQQPFDPVTVADWLQLDGALADMDPAYPSEIAAAVFSAANITAYAEIVLEKSRLRQAIDAGQRLIAAAQRPGHRRAHDIIAEAQHELLNFAPARATGPTPMREAIRAWLDRFQQLSSGQVEPGLPTPWADVNRAIHGLRAGEVYVLAARSNMGKSVAGFQLARFTAQRGYRTALWSLEMTKEAFVGRSLAGVGSIEHDWLVDPREGDHDANWSKLTHAIAELRDIDLQIDDAPQLSSRQIAVRARRLHLQKRLRLVVVDHLHEMALPGKQGEVIERAQALRDLKALAKELQCPVVALAQLNRAAAGAEAGRPTLKHLRGSGGIEEVADVVLFLHRPDYYSPSEQPGLVEVIVAKGRDVKTGTVVRARNRFNLMRLDDIDADEFFGSSTPLPPARNPYGFNEED